MVPAAYNPGKLYSKATKVLDAGARSEVCVSALLNRASAGNIDAWRRPGVRIPRMSGDNHIPDLAGVVDEIRKYVPLVQPQVKGRPMYNVLIEVKSQRVGGSVMKKIYAAIADLAHHADVYGTPAAVILDTIALSDQQIIDLQAHGTLNGVVVLTTAQIKAGLLIPELVKVVRLRRRLARRIGLRGGYTPSKNPDRFERALAARVAQRRATATAVRYAAAHGLLR